MENKCYCPYCKEEMNIKPGIKPGINNITCDKHKDVLVKCIYNYNYVTYIDDYTQLNYIWLIHNNFSDCEILICPNKSITICKDYRKIIEVPFDSSITPENLENKLGNKIKTCLTFQ